MDECDDRGMGQSRSMAQLAKWSESQSAAKDRVMKANAASAPPAKATPPVSVPKKIDNDTSYDDDFEDYNDDFEDEEISPPKPKAPVPAPAPAAKPLSSKPLGPSPTPIQQQQNTISDIDIAQLKKSMEIENSEALAKKQQQAKAESFDAKGHAGSLKPRGLQAATGNDASPTHPSTSSGAPPKAAPKRTNKFGALSAAPLGGGMSMDPRARRIARLRSSGVLDMQEEKFSNFHMVPCTLYDMYLRQLRSQNPDVKQIGVPVEEEKREIEIGTDEIVMVDKEMQASCGDDTALLNIMRVIQQRKELARTRGSVGVADAATEPSGPKAKSSKTKAPKPPPQESLLEAAKVIALGSQSSAPGAGSSGTGDNEAYSSRLSLFLRSASQLVETLLVEESQRNEEQAKERAGKSTGSGGRLQTCLDVDSPWSGFGSDLKQGSNELVRNRAVIWARFSPILPNMLITAHPPDATQEDDLRPTKGLYCIWDLLSPGAPSFVLECAGTPTCCCFSGTQSYLAVGATNEGVIALWDLREASHIHRDKDAVDLGIEKGVRKPCYYTTVQLNAQHDIDIDQHTAPIVQIEPIGWLDAEATSVSAAVSQFVSLDVCGTAVLWVTSESSSDAQSHDFGLAPWGRVSLVQMRVLRIEDRSAGAAIGGTPAVASNNKKIAPSAAGAASEDSSRGYAFSPQSSAVLATIPGDVSTFLTAGARGRVCKLVRFGSSGQSFVPNSSFSRPTGSNSTLEIFLPASGRSSSSTEYKLDLFAYVSCISVRSAYQSVGGFTSGAAGGAVAAEDESGGRIRRRESKEEKDSVSAPSQNNTTYFASLVLVGRTDGSVDLFQLDTEAPLQTWMLANYASSSNTADSRPAPVTMVKWVPRRAAAFIAVDRMGRIFYFDLLLNAFSPIAIDTLPPGSVMNGTVDLSTSRSGSRNVFLASSTSATGGASGIKCLQFHRISESVLRAPSVASSSVDSKPEVAEEILLRHAMQQWAGLTGAVGVSAVVRPASPTAGRK